TVPVYKKKKRLVISGKVISVLPRQYCSTVKEVLQYFQGSTLVLLRKYWDLSERLEKSSFHIS
ncbi:hypothetical protein, partial [Phocaeicola plebeius]